jgi:Domain of unknown function (DUF4160)
LGIIIYFYFKDHNPPHFHARYAEYEAEISIHQLTIEKGFLPPRVFGLVVEWAQLHKDELLENWKLTKTGTEFNPIAPLV